jgi:transposase
MDEGRFGLKVWLRARWCPRGVRPPWIVAERYQWRWLYAAVEPASGRSVLALLPGTDAACLQVFLDALAAEVGDARVGLVLDNSGSHRSRLLQWPERIVPLPLPPYTPELNPAERVFQVVRTALANRIFDDLDALDAALAEALAPYWQEPVRLQRLTRYSWWLAGVEHLSPMLPSAS